MNNFRDMYDEAFKAAFNREYEEAEVQPKVVELPEGKYQFAVNEVKIIDRNNLSKEGLKPDQYFDHTLVIQLKVLSEGPYKGSLVNKYNGLCLDRVKYIKGDLSAMGHEFEGLDKLFDDIEAGTMIGLIIDGMVTCKRNGDKTYTNIWLNRCVGRVKAEEAKGYTPVEDDDDLPWG